jgi:hypothetical protein
MTFFANSNFEIDITPQFQYEKGLLSTSNDWIKKPGYYLRLDKNQLSHTDYLKIRSIIIQLRIKQNNYIEIAKDFNIWKNASININWTYQIGGENFSVSHPQSIIVLQSMQDLLDTIPKMNPLYSTIHQLPPLEFQIFNDFELPNGFLSYVSINIGFKEEIKQSFYTKTIINYQNEK